MGKRRICPRCESKEVVRLPNDGVSPHPGYKCNGCGVRMRPNGSTIVWVAMVLIGIGVTAFCVLPLFNIVEADRVFVVLPIIGVVVAIYSIRQLFRPTPRLVEDNLQL
jgi:hypothetical protein